MPATRTLGDRIFHLAGMARPVMASRAWPAVALLIGSIPIAVGYLIGSSLHQVTTALLWAPLFWACICEDRLNRAIFVTGLVLGAHSAMAIVLSAHDPAGTAAVLPGGGDYWDQNRHWVQTGDRAGYEWSVVLARHRMLIRGADGC